MGFGAILDVSARLLHGARRMRFLRKRVKSGGAHRNGHLRGDDGKPYKRSACVGGDDPARKGGGTMISRLRRIKKSHNCFMIPKVLPLPHLCQVSPPALKLQGPLPPLIRGQASSFKKPTGMAESHFPRVRLNEPMSAHIIQRRGRSLSATTPPVGRGSC